MTKSAQNTVLRLPDKTDEVSNIYLRQGEADLVWRDFRRVSFHLTL